MIYNNHNHYLPQEDGRRPITLLNSVVYDLLILCTGSGWHFPFCSGCHFAFCILFFAQVDVFHHLENINLLITIVIIISALMMTNNRVLIVNYSQGTLEIHGQVNICASVWRFIFNMCDVSYLEIIVIYDNYFVCLC